jgi:hypothetical protein
MDFKTILTELSTDIILERFDIHPVDYGTDCLNGEWGRSLNKLDGYSKFNYTFFNSSSKHYMVVVSDDGQVKFNYVESIPDVDEVEILSCFEFLQFNSVPSVNVYELFGAIFYIIGQYTTRCHLTEIHFSGRHPKLQSMYNRLVRNKEFLRTINQIGFIYLGIDASDNFRFQRVV